MSGNNGNGTRVIVLRELVTAFLAFAGDNWNHVFANPKITTEAWVEELADIPPKLLQEALKRARRSKFMPNVGDVREIADSIAAARVIPSAADSRKLLDRGPKPPDWEPLPDDERAALFEKFKSRIEVVAEKKTMPSEDPDARLRKLRQQAAKLQGQSSAEGGDA